MCLVFIIFYWKMTSLQVYTTPVTVLINFFFFQTMQISTVKKS